MKTTVEVLLRDDVERIGPFRAQASNAARPAPADTGPAPLTERPDCSPLAPYSR